MSMAYLEQFANYYFKRYDIGRAGETPYLTRWVVWGDRYNTPALYLHRFHRGDIDPHCHDHPWPYTSLVLAGGYWEETPRGRRWYGPGSILHRPARHRHRVVLPEGQDCWTLFRAGKKCRPWFFWCPAGPVPWRAYVTRSESGVSGCGEDNP